MPPKVDGKYNKYRMMRLYIVYKIVFDYIQSCIGRQDVRNSTKNSNSMKSRVNSTMQGLRQKQMPAKLGLQTKEEGI